MTLKYHLLILSLLALYPWWAPSHGPPSGEAPRPPTMFEMLKNYNCMLNKHIEYFSACLSTYELKMLKVTMIFEMHFKIFEPKICFCTCNN